MKYERCTSCNRQESVQVSQGIAHDHPHGWGVITVEEQSECIKHYLLCKDCMTRVKNGIW